MIARTGYTGEDGFEIYIPSDEPTSGRVWGEVLEAGAEFGIVPCGLGSRNTLRLEAAMALYGHEISDTISVFEAGLGRYCEAGSGGQGRFCRAGCAGRGRGRRRAEAQTGRAGDDRARDRAGWVSDCVHGGRREDRRLMTSGSPAPFLKKNIALAYVPVRYAGVDEVQSRSRFAGRW